MARKCPLPRVGSKNWGWDLSAAGTYESLHSNIVIKVLTDSYCELEKAGDAYIRIDGPLSEAKCVAEQLTRRAWRQKNRCNAPTKHEYWTQVYDVVFSQMRMQFDALSTSELHRLSVLAANEAANTYSVLMSTKQPAKKD